MTLPGKCVAIRVFVKVIHQISMVRLDNELMYMFVEHVTLSLGIHEPFPVLLNQKCLIFEIKLNQLIFAISREFRIFVLSESLIVEFLT